MRMEMTIGEKIRKLRKELKLTQSQLAGSEMTKSMLSQIENNNASPSMKNLKHIADRLAKPISYFLEENYDQTTDEENTQNNNIPLKKINNIFKEADILITKGQNREAKSLLEDILKNYDINKNSKLYADICLKLGSCLGYLKEYDKSESKIKSAIKIFEEKHLFTDAAKAYMDLSIRYFSAFNYEDSLKIIDNAYELYEKELKTDLFFEAEYLHNKAIFLSALGKMKETMEVLNSAIKLSDESKVYYKSDELYRMRANIYLLTDKHDDYLQSIKKAQQFANFTENNISLGFIEYSIALYENDNNNPNKALTHIKKAHNFLGHNFYLEYIEEARSYYLLEEYHKAFELIKSIDFSQENVYHTMDFLLLWRGKIYEGLVLNKLGKTKDAMDSIKVGISEMEKMPKSKFLAFGYRSLSEMYSKQQDFEKAFVLLKKANEIEDNLKGMAY